MIPTLEDDDNPLQSPCPETCGILVSEHSLPKYNGIYTIQNTEINGKPWFKNNSGCILYFYNANGEVPHGDWMTVLKTELMIGLEVVG